MRNKRAQIGSTITWIVAFIVIFVVLFLFITITMGLAKVKGFSGTEKAQYNFAYSSGPEVYNQFIIFLKTKVEYDLILQDILRKAEEKENKTLEEIFQRECRKYLDSNFSPYVYGESFIALYIYSEEGFKYILEYSCSNSLGVVSEAPVYSTLVHKVEIPIFKNKRIVLSVSEI